MSLQTSPVGHKTEETPREIRVTDPRTGDLLEPLIRTPQDDLREVVKRAKDSFDDWAAKSPSDWAEVLRRAADAVESAARDLAELNQQETGRPLDEALAGIEAGISTLRQYAELGPTHRGHRLLGEHLAIDYAVPNPRGVVLILTPWNDPVAIIAGLVGAALATGNVVIHKASERCPRLGQRLSEIFESACPPGVFQHMVGGADLGSFLTKQPEINVIAHVGSTATGRKIVAEAARTGAHTICENGGNDPLIIDAGVDIGWAARQAALGSFANSGQICTAVERIFVHADIADEFASALTTEAESTYGQIAPLVDRRLRTDVHNLVSDAVSRGAQLLTGGEVPEGAGAFYPATVLSGCEPTMPLVEQEMFGPVAPIITVDDFPEAVRLANDTGYGLAATVLTDSMEHAHQAAAKLNFGRVKINAVFGGAPGGSAQPRGASGHGYGYGPELLDEMTQTKVVHLEPAAKG